MTVDSSGNMIGRQAHLPFGEDFAESGAQEKHHFTSYERDAESGLDYAVNRYDARSIGRFNQVDPIRGNTANPQSLNRYAYVANDPINSTDPQGLCPAGTTPGPDGECVVTLSVTESLPNPDVIDFSQDIGLLIDGGFGLISGTGIGIDTTEPIRDANRDRLANAFGLALAALQYSECQSLFDPSRVDPAFLLTALFSGSNLGSISFADLGGPDSSGNINNATTTGILGTRTVTLPSGNTVVQSTFTGANIVFNSNPASLFSTGTDRRSAITLIHELGHVANIIFGPGSSAIADDEGNPALSRQNSQSVRNLCF